MSLHNEDSLHRGDQVSLSWLYNLRKFIKKDGYVY
jgi:hypothetical protein